MYAFELDKIEAGFVNILDGLYGERWRDDANFQETPERVARSLTEMLYGENVREFSSFFEKKFPAAGYDSMIFTSNVQVYSMCPHHFLPVVYDMAICYIPNKEEGFVIGASKLPRLAEALAARAIIQEELTNEIANEIEKALNPLGVAVVVSGEHHCMRGRGIKQRQSTFETSEMRGSFRNNESTRLEFFELLKNSKR